MLVLAIESTCDETAAAVVEDGSKILSNVICSQTDLHKDRGGTIPEAASRQHIDVVIPIIDQALKEANCTLKDIDLIAAAKGPGLIGSLLVGLNVAKALSFALNIPFIGVNHVEAHLYASMMPKAPVKFPALGLIISGGHTVLTHIDAIGEYHIISTTVDDAIGEAFDKVATLLGLPYPGGPFIENLATSGDPYKYSFNAGKVKGKPLHFSFSGLKTNVLYHIKGQDMKSENKILTEQEKCDIAASFQRACFSDVVNKTLLALDRVNYHALIIGGGVSSNKTLKKMFHEALESLPQYWPQKSLSGDNAAMLAGLAYHQYNKQKASDTFYLKAQPRIPYLL